MDESFVRPIGKVGIVGAGTMGLGIARLALASGHSIHILDLDRPTAVRARDRLLAGLARSDSGKSTVSNDAVEIAPDLGSLATDADLVIETVAEDLGAKQSIFRTLGSLADPDAILATNTSALRVRDIASGVPGASRLLGLHFFNPAHRMPLVEVVTWQGGDPELVTRITELMRGWGKFPITCTDTPGFIVNRVNRPFTLQALRLVEAGRASIPEVDAAVLAAGYPMGPFRLMDLIGIDTNFAVARALWMAFRRDARFEPSSMQERLIEAGHLGLKTGAGFYLYEGTTPIQVNPALIMRTASDKAMNADEILGWIEPAILNEAYEALAEGVATKTGIDRALELGAGHPLGPFALAQARGGARHSLESVQRLEVESLGRYRPSKALLEAAALAH